MIILIWMLAVVAISLATLLQSWLLALCAICACVYLVIRRHRYPVFFIGMWGLLLTIIYFQPLNNTKQSLSVFVVSTHERYMIVQHRWHRYYIQQEKQAYDLGDILHIQGTILPLRLPRYESVPSLHDSLIHRGVSNMIRVDTITVIFHNPIRIYQIKKTIVERYPPTIQATLSRIMFDERLIGEDSYAYDVIAWLSISGFGFYLATQVLEKMWTILIKKRLAMVMTLLTISAYGLLMIHSVSITRIVLLYAMQTFDYKKRLSRHHYRLVWLSLTLVIFPQTVLHRSMQWYWIYQGWFFLLLPLLTQVRWKQYGLTLGFGLIVQILFVQSMQPLSVLLFVPIGLIQAGLWLLMSVWTWLPLPLWQGMEQLLSHLFETLSVLTMFNQSWIIGTFTNVMVLSLIVGLIVMLIAWFYKHMSIFRSMSVLASVAFIFHLLAIDITLLESSLHFINVGQGDATLIRHRQHAVLIDTGGHLRVDIAEAVLIPYFRNIRLRKLDAVIITHDDFDHNGALANLRNRFPIHRVIDTRFSHATWGQIHIAQLTYDTPMDADDNEKSLVLRFQFDRCIVMVMGDASVRNEALLINRYSDLKTHILRIGHHGSNTSTSQAFLQHTQPDIAVISLSAGNRYGHPHPEVVMRLQSLGVAIRRTDIEGTIVYRRCII